MSKVLILTFSIFEVCAIRDFVQFGILSNSGFSSIRDFFHWGFCLIRDFVCSGFCPFGSLFIQDFVQFRISSVLDFIQFKISSIRDFVHSGFFVFRLGLLCFSYRFSMIISRHQQSHCFGSYSQSFGTLLMHFRSV